MTLPTPEQFAVEVATHRRVYALQLASIATGLVRPEDGYSPDEAQETRRIKIQKLAIQIQERIEVKK